MIARGLLAEIGSFSAILTFKIGRGDRKVTITLEANDTYTVKTVLIRNWHMVYHQSDVYCDQLAKADGTK